MFVIVTSDYGKGKNIRVFETETNCWLSPLPVPYNHRFGFAYNGELYMFCGNLPLILTFIDLWKFNSETFSWMMVKPKGEGPSQTLWRGCLPPQILWDGSCMGDRIMVFAGHEQLQLYILDLNPTMKMLCKLAVIEYDLEQSQLPHDIRWELRAMASASREREDVSVSLVGSFKRMWKTFKSPR